MLHSKAMLLEDRKIKYWFEILTHLKNIKNARLCFDNLILCEERKQVLCSVKRRLWIFF